MITIRVSGGLGNQMFQYAFGRAKALKNKSEFRIFFEHGKSSAKRDFLLENFNIKSETAEKLKIKDKLFKITEEEYTFSQKMYDISDGYFVGIWQSEKYFKDFENEIRADFVLKNDLSVKASEIKNVIASTNSASIHVRRGDYALDERVNKKHGLVPLEYYARATAYTTGKIVSPKFFVFSDDIAWAKANLSLPPSAVFVSGNGISECEEMVLMSLCKHNIIANSTFSWWGAWLNQNKNKIVIAPEKWFASGADESDLIPENWIRIQ